MMRDIRITIFDDMSEIPDGEVRDMIFDLISSIRTCVHSHFNDFVVVGEVGG